MPAALALPAVAYGTATHGTQTMQAETLSTHTYTDVYQSYAQRSQGQAKTLPYCKNKQYS
jgi:hypothetical protein